MAYRPRPTGNAPTVPKRRAATPTGSTNNTTVNAAAHSSTSIANSLQLPTPAATQPHQQHVFRPARPTAMYEDPLNNSNVYSQSGSVASNNVMDQSLNMRHASSNSMLSSYNERPSSAAVAHLLNQQRTAEQQRHDLSKPVLVAVRVRDFAPLEDERRRAVFVTGQRTLYVQLPHQRGKVEFAVDSVIGGGVGVGNVFSSNSNNSNGRADNSNYDYSYQQLHQHLLSPNSLAAATRGTGSQQHVYDTIGEPLVDTLLGGTNCSVLLYGPSSCGKTFTAFGPPDSLGTSLEGLIPRMMRAIFEATSNATVGSAASSSSFYHTNISISIIEVYLEDCFDLLDPSRPKLKLRGDSRGGFSPVGETCVRVTCYDDVRQLLADAERRRIVWDQNSHHRSSRSHVLFFAHLQRYMSSGGNNMGNTRELSSRLLVADLAGSERCRPAEGSTSFASASGMSTSVVQQQETNLRFEQACNINLSLLALGSVIEAAAARDTSFEPAAATNSVAAGQQQLLPEFRRSTLTKLMGDHIGGNARTVVLITVSPAADSANNSIQALRFGQRAMKVITRSRINVALRTTSPFATSTATVMGQPNSSTSARGRSNNNQQDQHQQQQQQYDNDPALEHLKLRITKRRALVEVECALEQDLLRVRRRIARLENDLARSPNLIMTSASRNNSINNNSFSGIVTTSDILELKAHELQQAIAEESRIEDDLFTLFDCPPSSAAVNRHLQQQQAADQEVVDEAELEAEQCTLFAIVRRRHEEQLNDVRAQAWKTTQQAVVVASPQLMLSQQRAAAAGSPNRAANGGVDGSSHSGGAGGGSPINNTNNNVSSSSPSKTQLERLITSLHDELDECKQRLEDREQKAASLAQRLLQSDIDHGRQLDLLSLEHDEEMQRHSLELLQVKYDTEIRGMFAEQRVRVEYFGRIASDRLSQASFADRERALRREVDDARRDARNAKEEAENLSIKLDISETERSQYARDFNHQSARIAELEHQLETLKGENKSLQHHAQVMKTHYEHDRSVADLRQQRVNHETALSLERFRMEGQRQIESLKQTTTTAAAVLAQQQQQPPQQPAQKSPSLASASAAAAAAVDHLSISQIHGNAAHDHGDNVSNVSSTGAFNAPVPDSLLRQFQQQQKHQSSSSLTADRLRASATAEYKPGDDSLSRASSQAAAFAATSSNDPAQQQQQHLSSSRNSYYAQYLSQNEHLAQQQLRRGDFGVRPPILPDSRAASLQQQPPQPQQDTSYGYYRQQQPPPPPPPPPQHAASSTASGFARASPAAPSWATPALTSSVHNSSRHPSAARPSNVANVIGSPPY